MATENRPPPVQMLVIVVSVVAISLLHYASSPQWLAVHELLKRAYYVPIVVAAMLYGMKGGVMTSVLATVMYLPHVAMGGHGWPSELGPYAEIVLFNTVGIVTGLLADRLHAERNRHQAAADDLRQAYLTLEAHADARAQIDRWVTIGRLAAGAAHEIRNPLGGLLGALEILESDFPLSHPKAGFIDLAKRDIRRLENVVSTFVEFAQPAPPSSQDIEVGALLDAVHRLAAPTLGARGVEVAIVGLDGPLVIHADVEQCERALVNVLLEAAGSIQSGTITLSAEQVRSHARITIEIANSAWPPESLQHLFEPFAVGGANGGLALAVARRLIENQHGTVSAEHTARGVLIAIELPLVDTRDGSLSIKGEPSPRGGVVVH